MTITNPYYEFDPTFTPGTKARSDAVNLQYQALQNAFDFLPSGSNDALTTNTATFAPESGIADAYVVTMPDTRLAEQDGDEVVFFAGNSNTGPSTLEVDVLGPKAIVDHEGTALVAGGILAGICYIVRYDASNVRYQMVSPVGDYGAAAAASAAIALAAAVAADASADLAMEWAVNPIDDDVTGFPGQYSALHWADGASQAWAIEAEDSAIQASFGGDGATTFSSFHWAQKALASVASNRVNTDIPTATPPTTEAVTGNFDIYDATDDDQLASYGFQGSNDLQLRNYMHGGVVSIRGEDGAGTVATMGSFDPAGEASLMYADTVHFETAVGGIRVVDGAAFIDGQAAAETPVAGQGAYWVLEGVAGGDALWGEVELLAKFEGSDGATAYTEVSVNAANGAFANNAEIDTAQSNFGSSSLLVTGPGNSDEVVFPDISAYDHSTNDWTHEGFVRFASIPPLETSLGPGYVILSLIGTQDVITFALIRDGFGTRVRIEGNGWAEVGSTSLSTDTWYHWAVTRDSGQIRAYFDGFYEVGDFGAADADMGNASQGIRLGALDAFGTATLDGWIDDYRFTNGTARYTGTGAITVPSSDFAESGATPNTPMYTDDLGTDFILNSSSASEIQPGTADGQIPLWDQSVDTEWEPSAHLTIAETGAGGTAKVEFFGVGASWLSWNATDGGVVIIEEAALRLTSGTFMDLYGSAGGRARILTNASDQLHFTQDSGIVGALFDYPVNIAGTSPALQGTGVQLFAQVDSAASSLYGRNLNDFRYNLQNYSTASYRFNNPTAAADPGAEFFRVNNASFAASTEMYFDDNDYAGNTDAAFWFDSLAVGDLIHAVQGSDPTRWIKCTVVSVTDNTGWYTIVYTVDDSSGTVFINGEDVQLHVEHFSLIPAGAAAGVIVGDINTGTPPTTEAITAQLIYTDLAGDDNIAEVGFNGSNNYLIDNLMEGGNVSITATDDTGVVRTMFVCNPDGTTDLSSRGTTRFRMQTNGRVEMLSDTSTDTEDRTFIFAHQDGTDRARLGHNAASDVFALRNMIHGGNLEIGGEDAGGTYQEAMVFDPDGVNSIRAITDQELLVNETESGIIIRGGGGVELYHNNGIEMETVSTGVSLRAGANLDFSASMQIREGIIDMNGLSGGLNLVGQDEADEGFVLQDGARVTFQDLAFANHVYLRNEGIGGGSGTLTMRMDSSANLVLAGPGFQLNNSGLSNPVGLTQLSTPSRLNISQSVRMQGGLFGMELTTADTDISGNSQLWVEDTNPPRWVITDETGDDFVVGVAGGHAGPGQNVNVNNSHNFNTADHYAGNHISYFGDGSNNTVTLEDSSSTVNWPLYTSVTLLAPGSGNQTITEGSGTTLFDDVGNDTVGGVTLSQGIVTIFRAATGTYIIWGSGWS